MKEKTNYDLMTTEGLIALLPVPVTIKHDGRCWYIRSGTDEGGFGYRETLRDAIKTELFVKHRLYREFVSNKLKKKNN